MAPLNMLHVRTAMLCLLALWIMSPLTVAVAVRVALIPDYIQLDWENTVNVDTATDVQTCLDAAYNAEPTFDAISFDSGTGDCRYHSGIIASSLRASGEQPNYWLRVEEHKQWAAATSCLEEQDARCLLLKMTYDNQTCFKGSFDTATGLCKSDYSPTTYDYDAGSLQDGTGYLLSVSQAADSVNYLCDNEQDMKMIFNGTWYCYFSYTLKASEVALGESLISEDYCSTLFDPKTHVPKISEPREYEWLYRFFGRTGAIHLGVTLLSGTTYQWYDGTVASDLPWAPGAPLGGSNTLVQLVSPGYTVEDTEPRMTRLICKTPATYAAYDACSEFKIKTTTTTTSTTTTTPVPCPALWTYCPNTDHCYQWVNGSLTQPEGQAQCQSLGGNLATIDTPDATQCVIDLSAKNSDGVDYSKVWIGLYVSDGGADWKWVDGTQYDYKNFAPGSPSGLDTLGRKEPCVHAWASGGTSEPLGTWNDIVCDEEYANPALCSTPANLAG